MFPLLMIAYLSLTLEEQEIEAANVFGGGPEAGGHVDPVQERRPRAHQYRAPVNPRLTRPHHGPRPTPMIPNMPGPAQPSNQPRPTLPPINREPQWEE